MFNNPTASFKTAKSSLQTAEKSKETFFFDSTSETVVVYILYQLSISYTKQSELGNKISTLYFLEIVHLCLCTSKNIVSVKSKTFSDRLVFSAKSPFMFPCFQFTFGPLKVNTSIV